MIECKICKSQYKNKRGLTIHLRSHNMSSKEYHLIFYKSNCVICKKEIDKFYRGKFPKTCGKECSSILSSLRIHNESTKEKIRKARISYLRENQETSPWRRRAMGKMSYLESWFFDNVIKVYNLDENHKITSELYCGGYFIDFAFENIRLAVELDGAVHFKNGSRLKKDELKDAALNQQGWSVYRIPYFKVQKEEEKTIIEFMSYLNTFKPLQSTQIVGYERKTKTKKEIKKNILMK